jgi:hypothetical protein
MKKALAVALLALTLTGCETATVFTPLNGDGVGYSEQPLEQGRWRVTFQGGSGAGPDRVGDLALLRAADLTVAQGYDWFRVTNRYLRRGGGGSGPFVSLGGGSASFGRGSAIGVGGGVGFDLGGGPRASQTLEIMMGHGARPDEPDAYDARQVRASIGPRA